MSQLTPTQSLSQHSISSEASNTDKIYDPPHIFDPVHGYIEIPDRIIRIINTPQFQRLRNLKQLGTSYYVFPGASHNRFEHSIGVMHLAHKMIKHLQSRQPVLCITEDDIFCVAAAGLLHDIGHGPFSHVFDHEFVPSVKDCKFRHEDMSVRLIKDVFIDNNIDINDEHLLLIQALISPSTHDAVYKSYKEKGKGFLFEIVANELTGVDVDKWDYFLRDSQSIGITTSFKYERLLEHARVIHDHICWAEKTSFELYTMFRTRYELFRRVYSHKASKAIEYMICDILREANDVFNIVSKIDDTKKYLELTDHIISHIKFKEVIDGKPGMEGLKKAQKLIKRIDERKLYKCCGYLLLSPQIVAIFNPKQPEKKTNDENEEEEDDDIDMNHNRMRMVKKTNEEKQDIDVCHEKIAYHEIERKWAIEMYDIFKKQENMNNDQENIEEREELTANDLVIQLMSLSFGMETQHPMEQVFLYNSENANKCKQVHVDQITTMSGSYREVVVRAYTKKSEWKTECEQAFKLFVKQKGLVQDDDYDNDANHASLVISPKQRIKTKKRRGDDNNNNNNNNDDNDDNDDPLTPDININDKKRKRRYSNRSQSITKSIDFMDQPQRNKKPRHK